MKNPSYYFRNNMYVLDYIRGDVTGDGANDRIFLIGQKENSQAAFADNIMMVIQNGATGQYMTLPLKENAGYGASLFLADFTKDSVLDILVSIDSGGSGGLAYYYIYSVSKNQPVLIFDFEVFNQAFPYTVRFLNGYKLEVVNVTMKEQFILDITGRGQEYLDEIYKPDGTLKEPIEGWVNPLGGLFPIVRDKKAGTYDLLAMQRIVGRYNADSFGYAQTFLTWNGKHFVAMSADVAVFGNDISKEQGD
ncbi:hypothetical protein JOC78_001177 [Bacillus ectoiniformans]|uniref:VCBS repeat-containing protein n=1 Tax=Bacillus ectoiniformans TaxID=1494429 RepID=UPI00195E6C14|nr:VCBS repeat-containing protein [Bacillus ectoiniformans]MBM7648235.1 hypothetical protein [Bacillus ectoiniformans]